MRAMMKQVLPWSLAGVLFLPMGFGPRIFDPICRAQQDETRISGRMLAADDGPLAGVIMIEEGRLYGKNYRYGGVIDAEGRFSVRVAEGGDYGLHLYATGYIYYPTGVEVEEGKDNRFEFTLPPNPAEEDAPTIARVSFDEHEDTVTITLNVEDPNENLSHQVLGANVRTQEGFIFSPPGLVMPWTKSYPNGVYTLDYEKMGRRFRPEDWVFVTADNRCYNSPVLSHPFTKEGIIVARSGEPREQAPTAGLSALERGRKVFEANCAVCHYADKDETKVGPGLKGLFKKERTPVLKRPVTEENIRSQIQQGGGKMPPYSHIKGEDLAVLIEYLRSL